MRPSTPAQATGGSPAGHGSQSANRRLPGFRLARRYRAYQASLAGCTIGETLGQAVTFLTLTGATAASTTDTSQPTAPTTRPV